MNGILPKIYMILVLSILLACGNIDDASKDGTEESNENPYFEKTILVIISRALPAQMHLVEIGSENSNAGPFYEPILKKNDNTLIKAFRYHFDTVLKLANDPVRLLTGSSKAQITMLNHGLEAGDIVHIHGLQLNIKIDGEFKVTNIVDENRFEIHLPSEAEFSGFAGGNQGVVKKVLDRDIVTLWQSGDASDNAVRTTTFSNTNYNYIIRNVFSHYMFPQAEVCYSASDSRASFETINAAPQGGEGDIICH